MWAKELNHRLRYPFPEDSGGKEGEERKMRNPGAKRTYRLTIANEVRIEPTLDN